MKMYPGHHTVTPYLIIDGVDRLLAFLQKIFDVEVTEKVPGENGRVRHAEIKLGDSIVMIADSTPQYKPFPAMLYVYVENTDETYRRALEAGAVGVQEPVDADYGARTAGFNDAFGNSWWLATLKQ